MKGRRNTPAPAPEGWIEITGAREHNLKNLDLRIPRGRFVVITGVSGSGKSTLAFDLLFAEGQRRFLDSMNTYARQFVEQLARPDVDDISGLPPAVSIEQRNSRGGGKSTVATVTELYHFIRLLFAKLGLQHCPTCHVPVRAQTRDELTRGLKQACATRGDLLLLAPIIRNRKGIHTEVADTARRLGYKELRADGEIYDLSEEFRLERFREHDVEIVIGVLEAERRKSRRGKPRRIPASSTGKKDNPWEMVDAALSLGKGTLYALDNQQLVTIHSTQRTCPSCSTSFPPLDPKMFSYNSSQGWCPTCHGFGEVFAQAPSSDKPDAEEIESSLWTWNEGQGAPCSDCHGARLHAIARAVRLPLSGLEIARPAGGGAALSQPSWPSIVDISALSVDSAASLFADLKLTGVQKQIARDLLPEINERLGFLRRVGLGYLNLGRSVTTLSGGEGQRIRLAAQLGSNLSGVLYVLDEPTIGLHARDNDRLLEALSLLRARGNSVIVVEHDEETMRQADWILDLGPGAGTRGGEVVAQGTLKDLQVHSSSQTGACLRAVRGFPARGERRPVNMLGESATPSIQFGPISVNNLKQLAVRIPLGRFVVVTGVSGSGKSTLIRESLLPALKISLLRSGQRKAPKGVPADIPPLSGYEGIHSVHEVDQSPIGRTPRSTPATYVGFFNDIRDLFAQTPEARMRGYTQSRFSFNSAQGRCPICEGSGMIKLEMNFLPPAFTVCESCKGARFNQETLDVEFRGRNIKQVLDMSVDEAVEFFSAFQKIGHPLRILQDTGLGYLRIGQTSPTLSGGEAQRMKLVTHLLDGLNDPAREVRARRTNRPVSRFIMLEEPTVGLHMSDVKRLVDVLQRLVDAGHTVLVIEHNLDLIAEADWILDLGPEAGDGGGQLVAEGTPEQVAAVSRSHTGRYLAKLL